MLTTKQLLPLIFWSICITYIPLNAMNPVLQMRLMIFNTLPIENQIDIAIYPDKIASFFGPEIISRSEIPLLNEKLMYLKQPIIDHCRNLLNDHQPLICSLEKNIGHISVKPNLIISDDEATQLLLDQLAFDTLSLNQQRAFITLVRIMQNHT